MRHVCERPRPAFGRMQNHSVSPLTRAQEGPSLYAGCGLGHKRPLSKIMTGRPNNLARTCTRQAAAPRSAGLVGMAATLLLAATVAEAAQEDLVERAKRAFAKDVEIAEQAATTERAPGEESEERGWLLISVLCSVCFVLLTCFLQRKSWRDRPQLAKPDRRRQTPSPPPASATAAEPPSAPAPDPAEPPEPPDELCCPITMALYNDPVTLSSGHVYERKSIERSWEANPLKDPFTQAHVQPMMIISWHIRRAVDKWLEANPSFLTANPDYVVRRSTEAALKEACVKWECLLGPATVYLLGELPANLTDGDGDEKVSFRGEWTRREQLVNGRPNYQKSVTGAETSGFLWYSGGEWRASKDEACVGTNQAGLRSPAVVGGGLPTGGHQWRVYARLVGEAVPAWHEAAGLHVPTAGTRTERLGEVARRSGLNGLGACQVLAGDAGEAAHAEWLCESTQSCHLLGELPPRLIDGDVAEKGGFRGKWVRQDTAINGLPSYRKLATDYGPAAFMWYSCGHWRITSDAGVVGGNRAGISFRSNASDPAASTAQDWRIYAKLVDADGPEWLGAPGLRLLGGEAGEEAFESCLGASPVFLLGQLPPNLIDGDLATKGSLRGKWRRRNEGIINGRASYRKCVGGAAEPAGYMWYSHGSWRINDDANAIGGSHAGKLCCPSQAPDPAATEGQQWSTYARLNGKETPEWLQAPGLQVLSGEAGEAVFAAYVRTSPSSFHLLGELPPNLIAGDVMEKG